MILQNFLRSGGTIEDLATKFAIKTNRHSKYNNLVLFKYDMIESPMVSTLVQECRGVILDEKNNWEIVSRPFDKFFNYGEGHAKNIDWTTAKVQEKVDGSLATIYVYDNAWHIATSGTCDAGGLVNDFGFTFAELFWKTFEQYDIVLPNKNCSMSFMFELTSQYNKIVVRHTQPGLTLLGGRNLLTQQEITAETALKFFQSWDPDKRTGVRRAFDKLHAVKEYPLTSFEECIATFPSIDPTSQEGYVVVDGNFNRVKVKSPAYVALHHMKDALGSAKALVTVALNGEIDEVIVSFPEFKEELTIAKAKIYDLVVELETAYDKIKHHTLQKDFALEAIKTRCSSALFAVRGGKSPSIRSHLQKMSIDSIMSVLGYK